jgi:hypothetical protein
MQHVTQSMTGWMMKYSQGKLMTPTAAIPVGLLGDTYTHTYGEKRGGGESERERERERESGNICSQLAFSRFTEGRYR